MNLELPLTRQNYLDALIFSFVRSRGSIVAQSILIMHFQNLSSDKDFIEYLNQNAYMDDLKNLSTAETIKIFNQVPRNAEHSQINIFNLGEKIDTNLRMKVLPYLLENKKDIESLVKNKYARDIEALLEDIIRNERSEMQLRDGFEPIHNSRQFPQI
ncbi:MAG: hypothetical protein Kow0081_3320 [Candidatus Dojkabacteria bacterium]